GPDLSERYLAAARAKRAQLQEGQARESDPLVQQDLQILIDSLEQSINGTELSDRLTLDWYDIPRTIFGVMNGLLDDQVEPARRQTAKELLERYTGLHPGSVPLVEQARARWQESLGPGKVGPYRGSVEDTLGKTDTYIDGIRQLFTRYQIEGADRALDEMERQLREYADWERATVLPAAREDFRLPPELYAHRLRTFGIDLPPEQLIARARRGFYETRAQMEALAPLVAAKFGFAETDYPSVIEELKKIRIPQDRMEAHYAKVLGELQDIAARERVVSLPDYPVLMRLGTEAENAASPAPHMRPPRLIGN